MSWFKRKEAGITTPTTEKKDSPDGLWKKSPNGKLIHIKELKRNAYVYPDTSYHERIGSEDYFDILFDLHKYTELDENITSADPLNFVDTKPYPQRVEASQKKTGLKDAVRTAVGTCDGHQLVVSCMDFSFIGGSMGSVVGEKIARGIKYSLDHKIPFLMISRSGGARMMEAGYSLMQMAKTSARLAQLGKARVPYISLLTDPTTGGVTASYAMLGDINIAEPNALIGFAGPRVIRETIGKDLPKGFQRAEFLLEHGFVDMIVDRRDLRKTMGSLLAMFKN